RHWRLVVFNLVTHGQCPLTVCEQYLADHHSCDGSHLSESLVKQSWLDLFRDFTSRRRDKRAAIIAAALAHARYATRASAPAENHVSELRAGSYITGRAQNTNWFAIEHGVDTALAGTGGKNAAGLSRRRGVFDADTRPM
ncbi:MAG: hypothetical protein WA728_26065, partial [Xanthobacteraceae bacterium]